jgi:hypothetical protein
VKPFVQFIIAACIGLLSWWQLELYIGLGFVTLSMLAAGAVAAALTWRSSRIGYGMAVVVGLAYLAEIVWLTPPSSLSYLQPLLAWSIALIACGSWLHWTTREKRSKAPSYERHPEY